MTLFIHAYIYSSVFIVVAARSVVVLAIVLAAG